MKLLVFNVIIHQQINFYQLIANPVCSYAQLIIMPIQQSKKIKLAIIVQKFIIVCNV